MLYRIEGSSFFPGLLTFKYSYIEKTTAFALSPTLNYNQGVSCFHGEDKVNNEALRLS